jgi:hypothetical protein
MNSNHTTLFYNLMRFICDAGVRFCDLRTTVTFVWAVFGLIVSECVHLNMWALFRPGKAQIASKERQFSRWLHNDRIRPMLVYRPLIEKALQKWAGDTLYLALDTSQFVGSLHHCLFVIGVPRSGVAGRLGGVCQWQRHRALGPLSTDVSPGSRLYSS